VVKLPEVSIKRFNEINSFLDEEDDILPRGLGLSAYLISIVDFLIYDIVFDPLFLVSSLH